MTFRRRDLTRALPVLAALLIIGFLTLEPRPRQAPLSATTPWLCLVCGPLGTVDVLLNIALFVPLGLALQRFGRTALTVLLIGLATSVGVEALQLAVISGRDSSLSDLLTNTLGTWLGYRLGRGLPTLLHPDPRRSHRLALLASGFWLLLLGFTAWAVRPAPPPGNLALRLTPFVPGLETFRGRVIESAFGTGGAAQSAAAIRRELTAGRGSLHARVTLESWPEALAPVVDISGASQVSAARLGQLGQKVLFSVRTNAERVRLRTPAVKVYRALPAPSGQEVTIGGSLSQAKLSAYADDGGSLTSASLALTPGLGWALVLPLTRYPFDYRPDITSAIWTALPLVIVGYWMARSRAGRKRQLWRTGVWYGAWGGVLLSLGLMAIPSLGGVAAQGGRGWVACAGALLIGAALGYASLGRRTAEPPMARSAASP